MTNGFSSLLCQSATPNRGHVGTRHFIYDRGKGSSSLRPSPTPTIRGPPDHTPTTPTHQRSPCTSHPLTSACPLEMTCWLESTRLASSCPPTPVCHHTVTQPPPHPHHTLTTPPTLPLTFVPSTLQLPWVTLRLVNWAKGTVTSSSATGGGGVDSTTYKCL